MKHDSIGNGGTSLAGAARRGQSLIRRAIRKIERGLDKVA